MRKGMMKGGSNGMLLCFGIFCVGLLLQQRRFLFFYIFLSFWWRYVCVHRSLHDDVMREEGGG